MTKRNKLIIIEEIFNAITHGIGTILGIVASIILLIVAAKNHNALKIISFSVFGFTLILMYLTSTLFHSLIFSRAKKVFAILDHSFIYLFIAGTYTPFILLGLKGNLRSYSLIAIWTITIVSIVITIFNIEKEKLSLIMYLSLGWFVIFVIKPLYQVLSIQGLIFLFIGGVFYTSGVLFYIRSKYAFNHFIWHLFVLGGSIFHFTAMFYL